MSALIVTVSLPGAIEQFRRAHVPTAAGGVPPHVTLLYPFVPIEEIDEAVRAAVAATVARHASFRFRLAGLGRWPASVYLEVVPARPFERLVASLVEAFPGFPPYSGVYPYVPHVSLAEDDPDISLDPLAGELEALAGVPQRAVSVELIAQVAGVWATRESYRLGSTVEPRATQQT